MLQFIHRKYVECARYWFGCSTICNAASGSHLLGSRSFIFAKKRKNSHTRLWRRLSKKSFFAILLVAIVVFTMVRKDAQDKRTSSDFVTLDSLDLMALDTWKKLHKDHSIETCPCGSKIELHEHDPKHGDICRLPDQNFVCPNCCDRSPTIYCINKLGGPCRTPCPSSHLNGGVEPSKLFELGLVIRTWHKDVELAVVAMRSLVEVIPHDVYRAEIIFITDEGSAMQVQAVVQEELIAGNFQPLPDHKVRVVVEELFMEGHIQQKYSKLTADLHTNASLILHIDSDMRYHTWDEKCFFADGYLPVLDYAPWWILPKEVMQWKEGSERLLGIPDVQYEFSRTNQHIYPRELYSALRARVENVMGKDFKSVFTDTPLVGTGDHKHQNPDAVLVSDFNLLGAMAYYHMPRGTIYFRNNAEEVGSANCQSQCNSRLFSSLCCTVWYKTIESYQKENSGSICGYNCTKEFLFPLAPLVCIRDKQKGTRAVGACNVERLYSKKNMSSHSTMPNRNVENGNPMQSHAPVNSEPHMGTKLTDGHGYGPGYGAGNSHGYGPGNDPGYRQQWLQPTSHFVEYPEN